jgi:hypothetical protein
LLPKRLICTRMELGRFSRTPTDTPKNAGCAWTLVDIAEGPLVELGC